MSAKAADLPDAGDQPAVALAATNWDGLYFGLHWGYGIGSTQWAAPRGYYAAASDVPATGDSDGLLGGAQIGYDQQYGALLVGIAGDVSAGRLLGQAACGATAGSGGSGDTCGNRTDLLASLTGRLGYAAGRSLVYVKGGGAYTHTQMSVVNEVISPLPPVASAANRYGWTVGAGVAYALDPNWSVNAEYAYYDFGRQTYASGTGVNAGSFSVAQVQQVAKFGLNYRLGGAGGGQGAALAISDDLAGEFGTRLGYSSGRFQMNLYDPVTPGHLNSVLTWRDQAGPAVEAFARVDHRSGLFLKGTLGGVSIGASHMNDEDTAAPGYWPYSNTLLSTRDGRNLYGTLDLGYTFWRAERSNLGGFVGYGHYRQSLNAYGCQQLATAPFCLPGDVPAAALVLSHREEWNTLRLGLTGSVMLSERLSLSGEAAWLPYASFSGQDNHWMRPDINPLIEEGHGAKSFQLEAALAYSLTRNWRVGAALRYLSLEATGSTQFPEAGLPKSPQEFASSRFTAFLQASYRFGNVAAP
jgi:opacity protein-like surface antigen